MSKKHFPLLYLLFLYLYGSLVVDHLLLFPAMVTKEQLSKSILTFATHSKGLAENKVSYTLKEY